MKKAIIITLVLAGLGAGIYYGVKAYKKAQCEKDPSKCQ